MKKISNPRLTSVKTILRAALKRLQTIGWCQRTSLRYNENDQVIAYCSRGAIYSVARSNEYSNRACEALQRSLGDECWSLVYWNDQPSRHKSQVINAFKNAISKA